MAQPLGFAGGLAQGFGTGAALGVDYMEAQSRRQALQMEMVNQNIDRVNTTVQAQLKNLQTVYANQNSRTPELEEETNQVLGGITDTINMLDGIPTKEAQAAKQAMMTMVNTAKMGLKTKGELAAEAALVEDQAIGSRFEKMFGKQAGPVPGQSPSPAPVQFGIDAAGQPMSTQRTAQATPGVGASTMPGAPGAGIGPEPALAGPAASAVPGQAQQPQAPAPIGNLTELVSIRQIPAADIELLLINPTQFRDKFEAKYGVSSDVLFADPEAPGSNPSWQDYYMAEKGIEIPGRKEHAAQQAKDFPKIKEGINDAKFRIRLNFQQRDALDEGIYSGWGADWQTFLQNARLRFVDDPEAQQKLANTNAYIQSARQKAAKIIKQFGAGTGLSDADLRFAFDLAAGNVTWDRATLEELLDLDTRMAVQQLSTPLAGQDRQALEENIGRLLRDGVDEDTITSILGK